MTYTPEQFAKVQFLAKKFLALADELNEQVTAYFNCSNRPEDEAAYWRVRAADKEFIDAMNEYDDSGYTYGLNYEVAESVNY